MIHDKVVLIENFSFFLNKCFKNFSLKIENKKLFNFDKINFNLAALKFFYKKVL